MGDGGAGVSSWGSLTAAGALSRFTPDAADVVHRLVATRSLPADEIAAIRATCGETTGLPAPPRPQGEGDADTSASTGRRDVAAEVARQFSTDVSAVTDEQRSRLAETFGAQAFTAVQMIWVADQVPRVRAALDALFGAPETGWVDPDPVDVDDPWPLVDELTRVVHNHHALDPVTSEIVRLHGARAHRCRLCQSLRSLPALEAGADEELFEAIDVAGTDDARPGPLTDRHRAALALVDAMIWHPAHLDPAMIAEVRARFSPAEAVEIVLDVMRNAANKIAVALRADRARVEEGWEVYDIDPDGTMRLGLAVPDVGVPDVGAP